MIQIAIYAYPMFCLDARVIFFCLFLHKAFSILCFILFFQLQIFAVGHHENSYALLFI